jgi:hypothetical protein
MSLNGQSQFDIRIDVRPHWYGGNVESDGQRVQARPEMISATSTRCWSGTVAAGTGSR